MCTFFRTLYIRRDGRCRTLTHPLVWKIAWKPTGTMREKKDSISFCKGFHKGEEHIDVSEGRITKLKLRYRDGKGQQTRKDNTVILSKNQSRSTRAEIVSNRSRERERAYVPSKCCGAMKKEDRKQSDGGAKTVFHTASGRKR